MSILKRMRHIYRMYTLTKFVADDIAAVEATMPNVAQKNGSLPKPVASSILAKYSKDTGLSYNQVFKLAEATIVNGYLAPLGEGKDHLGVTHDKGEHLVEGVRYFRWGLINAWFKEFNAVITVLISVIALMASIYAVFAKE
jgi:hypothetical protein